MKRPAAETYEVVRDPERLRALQPEWDQLWERAGDQYVTTGFAWCWNAWNAVARPQGRDLHCLVARRDGRVVLIWPLVVQRTLLWSRARPLGPEVAEYSSLLLEPGPDAERCAADAWEELRRTLHCDMLLLPYVPAGSLLHALADRQRRARLTDTTLMSSTRCDGEADRVNIAAMLDSPSLDRRRRKLAKRGELRYELVEDPVRRKDTVRWIMERKHAWLARTGGRPVWKRGDLYRDFLVAVAAADPHVKVFALTLGAVPLAACIARVDQRRFESFISAYDEQQKNFSPGQMLRVENMRWAFDRGLEYDMRVGEQAYKDDWTNRRNIAISFNLALSRRGALLLWARGAQLGLTARVRTSGAAFGS